MTRVVLVIGSPDPASFVHALAAADVLVVAHPDWRGKPPAVMAGWMGRVIVPGVVYPLATWPARRSSLPPCDDDQGSAHGWMGLGAM